MSAPAAKALTDVRPARIGLIDGSRRDGHLAFSPDADELVIEETTGAGDGTVSRVPAASISYVAFRRISAPPPACEGTPVARFRVHLADQQTFLVEPLTDPNDPVGFHAAPVDRSSEFEAMFFYTHATRALERDEPLGAMLVEAGALAPSDIARGLTRQAAVPRRRIGEILVARERLAPGALNDSLRTSRAKRIRIGEVLIERGLVSRDDVETALAEQRRSGGRRLGEILVEMGVVEERALASTLAAKFHMPFIDLDECVIDPAAVEAVPRWIVEKHHVLPIAVDDQFLTVAISDPLDPEPIDLIRFHRGTAICEVVAVPSQIARYSESLIPAEAPVTDASKAAALLASNEFMIDPAAADAADADDPSALRESDSAIIRLANQIIVEAVQRGASDIHIEPGGSGGDAGIRFRIDGQCASFAPIPRTHARALISRIKIMARLDISERRLPQDGKICMRLHDRVLEIRVATLPTVRGEDVVLRLLGGSGPRAIADMGLSDRNREELERMIGLPYGLILCVGPTGSGKTTSLHSLLFHINQPGRKIWTAEDPVEITQAGLRQVEVKPKIGFGFAEALRAFLRSDPDVIMVGEMRDAETANIAVESSLTGHLVLSTLHTNSAAETVVRLVKMGLDPFSFGDALLGVLAQRLVRRLCEGCRSLEPAQEGDLNLLHSQFGEDALDAMGGKLLWTTRGCDRCRGSGYRGRIAVHELLVVDENVRDAIHQQSNAARIRDLALAGGMRTLLHDGLEKCLTGATDVRQVLAACARLESAREPGPVQSAPADGIVEVSA